MHTCQGWKLRNLKSSENETMALLVSTGRISHQPLLLGKPLHVIAGTEKTHRPVDLLALKGRHKLGEDSEFVFDKGFDIFLFQRRFGFDGNHHVLSDCQAIYLILLAFVFVGEAGDQSIHLDALDVVEDRNRLANRHRLTETAPLVAQATEIFGELIDRSLQILGLISKLLDLSVRLLEFFANFSE